MPAQKLTVQYHAISIFQSRTFWWNVLALVVALLSMTEVASLIPAEYLSIYSAVVAIANIALRKVTVRPVALIAPGTTSVVAVERLGPHAEPSVAIKD